MPMLYSRYRDVKEPFGIYARASLVGLGTTVRDPVEEHRPEFDRSSGDWSVALAIAFAILICIVAFILIFIQLEPLLSDFVSEADLTTPTVEADSTPESAGP